MSTYFSNGGQHSTGQRSRKMRIIKSWSTFAFPSSKSEPLISNHTQRQINTQSLESNVYFRHKRWFWEHDMGISKRKQFIGNHTFLSWKRPCSSPSHFTDEENYVHKREVNCHTSDKKSGNVSFCFHKVKSSPKLDELLIIMHLLQIYQPLRLYQISMCHVYRVNQARS